jgi:hypothetical protein
MKKVFLFVLLLYTGYSISQKIETKFISSFPLKADQFVGVDEFKNMYYVNNNVLFKKYKDHTISYNKPNLGELTSVDILNPFKINLFYKDFNSLNIVDNNLNELADEVNFTIETTFNNVMFISQSSQNNIWLYADDNKLHLYNFKNRTEQIQTQPITFYQNNFIPIILKSTYKNVWIISKTGVIQFNEYGNFVQSFDIEGIEYFFPFRKSFIYFKNRTFYYYQDNRSVEILIDYVEEIEDIYINSSSVYIFNGKNVYQYDFLTRQE